MTAVEEISTTLHPLGVVRAGRWTRALFGTFALSLVSFTEQLLAQRDGFAMLLLHADIMDEDEFYE